MVTYSNSKRIKNAFRKMGYGDEVTKYIIELIEETVEKKFNQLLAKLDADNGVVDQDFEDKIKIK